MLVLTRIKKHKQIFCKNKMKQRDISGLQVLSNEVMLAVAKDNGIEVQKDKECPLFYDECDPLGDMSHCLNGTYPDCLNYRGRLVD